MTNLNALLGFVLVIWIMGLGFSMILRRHHAYMGWTGTTLRRVVNYIWRQIVRFCRFAWRRYWREILSYGAGVLTALYALGYFR